MSKSEIKKDAAFVAGVLSTAVQLAEARGADTVRVKFGELEPVHVPLGAFPVIQEEVTLRRAIREGWCTENSTRLNEAQFDALTQISRMRIGSDKYSATYRYFVEGLSKADSARLVGIRYQDAWEAIKAAEANIELCKKVAGK